MRPIRALCLAALIAFGVTVPVALPMTDDAAQIAHAQTSAAKEPTGTITDVKVVPTADAGAVAAAPEMVAPTPTKADFPDPVDPLEDPVKVVKVAKDVKVELGLVACGVFLLMCIADAMAKRAKPGSIFDRGRLPVILTALAGDLAALGGAMAGEISWTSAVATVIVSIAAVVRLNGAQPTSGA